MKKKNRLSIAQWLFVFWIVLGGHLLADIIISTDQDILAKIIVIIIIILLLAVPVIAWLAIKRIIKRRRNTP